MEFQRNVKEKIELTKQCRSIILESIKRYLESIKSYIDDVPMITSPLESIKSFIDNVAIIKSPLESIKSFIDDVPMIQKRLLDSIKSFIDDFPIDLRITYLFLFFILTIAAAITAYHFKSTKFSTKVKSRGNGNQESTKVSTKAKSLGHGLQDSKVSTKVKSRGRGPQDSTKVSTKVKSRGNDPQDSTKVSTKVKLCGNDLQEEMTEGNILNHNLRKETENFKSIINELKEEIIEHKTLNYNLRKEVENLKSLNNELEFETDQQEPLRKCFNEALNDSSSVNIEIKVKASKQEDSLENLTKLVRDKTQNLDELTTVITSMNTELKEKVSEQEGSIGNITKLVRDQQQEVGYSELENMKVTIDCQTNLLEHKQQITENFESENQKLKIEVFGMEKEIESKNLFIEKMEEDKMIDNEKLQLTEALLMSNMNEIDFESEHEKLKIEIFGIQKEMKSKNLIIEKLKEQKMLDSVKLQVIEVLFMNNLCEIDFDSKNEKLRIEVSGIQKEMESKILFNEKFKKENISDNQMTEALSMIYNNEINFDSENEKLRIEVSRMEKEIESKNSFIEKLKERNMLGKEKIQVLEALSMSNMNDIVKMDNNVENNTLESCSWFWQGTIKPELENVERLCLRKTLQNHTQNFKIHTKSIFALSNFEKSDIKYLTSGTADKSINILDLSDSENIQVFATLSTSAKVVSTTTFEFGGNQFLASGGNGSNVIQVWNLENYSLSYTLAGHSSSVYALTNYERNGKKILISGSGDTTIKLWDILSKTCVHTLKGNSSYTRSLDVCEKGGEMLLVSGHYDNTVKLWDLDCKSFITTLTDHSSYVYSLKIFYKYTEPYVASGSKDHTIKIWNLNSYHLETTLNGHEKSVWCLELISMKKLLLASGSCDKTIKLWDLKSYSLLRTLCVSSPVYSLIACHTVIPFLISGHKDGAIMIWAEE